MRIALLSTLPPPSWAAPHRHQHVRASMASDATFVEVGVRLGQRNQRFAENDCSADLFAEILVRVRDGCRRPDRRVGEQMPGGARRSFRRPLSARRAPTVKGHYSYTHHDPGVAGVQRRRLAERGGPQRRLGLVRERHVHIEHARVQHRSVSQRGPHRAVQTVLQVNDALPPDRVREEVAIERGVLR